jgi:hypothetical protein
MWGFSAVAPASAGRRLLPAVMLEGCHYPAASNPSLLRQRAPDSPGNKQCGARMGLAMSSSMNSHLQEELEGGDERTAKQATRRVKVCVSRCIPPCNAMLHRPLDFPHSTQDGSKRGHSELSRVPIPVLILLGLSGGPSIGLPKPSHGRRHRPKRGPVRGEGHALGIKRPQPQITSHHWSRHFGQMQRRC